MIVSLCFLFGNESESDNSRYIMLISYASFNVSVSSERFTVIFYGSFFQQ